MMFEVETPHTHLYQLFSIPAMIVDELLRRRAYTTTNKAMFPAKKKTG